MLNYIESLSFDDLLLIPKFSNIKSREKVDLSVPLSKGFIFDLPYVPSNMKTIASIPMAKLFYEHKSLAIMHRFTEFEKQLTWLREIASWKDGPRFVGFSIGVKEEDYERADALIKNGAEIIAIDIAHGWSEHGLKMTKYIHETYPDILLISGNAAEGEGAQAIFKAGADIVKLNVGNGSCCTTRIMTGNGVGSMTALSSAYEAKQKMERELNRKLFIMQDGGVNNAGAVSKALCFADLIMAGNLFAATEQTPGAILLKAGKDGKDRKYKKYVGSSTHKGKYKEGVEMLKEYKGDAKDVIEGLNEGVRSCCSYQGVDNLLHLKLDPRFVKISNAGLIESGPHDYDVLL